MKIIIFLFMSSVLFLQGCKNNNNEEIKTEQKKIEHWANYDDGLDIKSEVKVDTAIFRKEINRILTPEKIIEKFGSGYHNFYLALIVSKEGEAQYSLSPDISFWLSPGNDVRDMIFKEGVSSNAQLTTYMPKGYSNKKGIDNHAIFEAPFTDVENIFTVKPGILNGQPVRSVKLFEINVIVSKDGKILKPWSITESDFSKYREHFFVPNVNRYYFMTGLPAISVDGFESIRKAIVYPETALKYGISGRVIIELFADGEGKLAGYQFIKGLGHGCDEAVLNAIKQARFKGYPTGQRSSIIVPFEFGPPQTTPIDLAVQLFDFNPDTNVYNNIRLQVVNKNQLDKDINQKYFVYVYINGYCVFQSYCQVVSNNVAQGYYWFRWRPNKPGSYNYTIYIDPENRLNDSNRENNTVKGTFVVK